MKIYYTAILLFLISNLFSQSAISDHQFKLPGTTYKKLDFRTSGGDTIIHDYEKEMYVIEGEDSIVYVEFYETGKHWYLYRYSIKNGKPYLLGWQREYDDNGIVQVERQCPLGKRKCHFTHQYDYFPGGQLLSEGFFYKGQPTGTQHFYYSNGSIRQILEFNKGALVNVLAYYDQDGNPLDIGNFCDGEGYVNIYSLNGKLIQVKTFKKGKLKKAYSIYGS